MRDDGPLKRLRLDDTDDVDRMGANKTMQDVDEHPLKDDQDMAVETIGGPVPEVEIKPERMSCFQLETPSLATHMYSMALVFFLFFALKRSLASPTVRITHCSYG
jgi:hypothetical protein